MADALCCRSTATIISSAVQCSRDEGHTDVTHTATIRAGYLTVDTYGPARRGSTFVTVTWEAPVTGPDLRTDEGFAEARAAEAARRSTKGAAL